MSHDMKKFIINVTPFFVGIFSIMFLDSAYGFSVVVALLLFIPKNPWFRMVVILTASLIALYVSVLGLMAGTYWVSNFALYYVLPIAVLGGIMGLISVYKINKNRRLSITQKTKWELIASFLLVLSACYLFIA
jgi:hypothetical protein